MFDAGVHSFHLHLHLFLGRPEADGTFEVEMENFKMAEDVQVSKEFGKNIWEFWVSLGT